MREGSFAAVRVCIAMGFSGIEISELGRHTLIAASFSFLPAALARTNSVRAFVVNLSL